MPQHVELTKPSPHQKYLHFNKTSSNKTLFCEVEKQGKYNTPPSLLLIQIYAYKINPPKMMKITQTQSNYGTNTC